MGEVTYTQVRQEVERRFDSGEFRQASASVRGPQITTAAMLRTEREIIDIVQQGNGQHRPMLVEGRERFDTVDRHPELNVSQRQAVEEVFSARMGSPVRARPRRWLLSGKAQSAKATR
jgi:hypothetical protein